MSEACGGVNPMSQMRCAREPGHYGDHGDVLGRYWSPRSNVVDWPARFRAAAEVADRATWIGIGSDLRDLAFRIEVRHVPPDVVEAIGRVLLGQVEK